jgi:hypothetical protein
MKKAPQGSEHLNYASVPISGLNKSRKGKHHDLMRSILEDLRQSRPGFAVKIPLSSTKGVPVLNLRSVIVRTAARENIRVKTSSDDENFYVWRAS